MSVRTDWDLHVDVDAVLRGQGADPAVIRSRNQRLVKIAEQALEEGLPLVKPQVLFEMFKIESVNRTEIKIAGGKKLSGECLGQYLSGTSELAVIICSIGFDLEQYAAQVMETQVVRGLALYGVGSAAVEALANAVCSYLEVEARTRGLRSTTPLSPGMRGWPVEEGQLKVFSLVDATSINVRYLDNKFMLPLKSLSMVVGFAKKFNGKQLLHYWDNGVENKYRLNYDDRNG